MSNYLMVMAVPATRTRHAKFGDGGQTKVNVETGNARIVVLKTQRDVI